MADDNADMRKYLRHLLGGEYEVHTVSDGRQALETTRLLRPALLLADVMMPQLDGFGLLRAVRDDAVLASTRQTRTKAWPSIDDSGNCLNQRCKVSGKG